MKSPVCRRPSQRRAWAPLLGSAALLLAGLLLAGCGIHDYWDRVTSRDLTWQDRLWGSDPPPLEVLRSSSDGAKKSKALAALREPADPQTREEYLTILVTTVNLPDRPDQLDALQREPLCVLGAVYALGSYKDPRAVDALNRLYFKKLPFPSEMNSIVRQHILTALEETGLPEARRTLIDVARQPRAAGPAMDRREVNDERLRAIRALRKFKEADAAAALVEVLDRERDIAVRHRAHESLRAITGKNPNPDAESWRQALYSNEPTPEPSFLERVMWWKRD